MRTMLRSSCLSRFSLVWGCMHMAEVSVGVLRRVGRWWIRVGDVEACVDLFSYSPCEFVHLTLVSSTSFSVAQVVAAQEGVVAVAGVVAGEVAGAAVVMEASVVMEVASSFKRGEMFWIMNFIFSGGGGGCGGGCGGGGCGGG